ncbi:MAG TPA: amidohydrolase family protein [Thermoanaerobaculia bacterium]|nr:amidohydrolase family protein [Thermoanaerobaculia bacterium]
MRKLVRVTLMLLVTGAGTALPFAAPAAGQAPASGTTVLKAARVFTSTSERPLAPGMVVVEGDHIAQVGQNLAVPPGAQVIDLGDATLLPGFIDAHVHLAMEMSDDWYRDFYQTAFRFPAEQALYAAKYARVTLEAGFTTVRDVGSDEYISLGLRNAINAGIAVGPRMLIANHGIGSTGGHADAPPFPPERIKPAGTLEGVCNGPAQCREAVRFQIKFGADVIKCMPSGGVLSLSDPVDVPELTREEMDAIVSEAHAWHRKVAAHCHGDEAAKIAIAAGVDSIEHGSFLKDDTLRLMKEKGVYLVPTLFAGFWVGEKADHFPPAIAVKARAAAAQMQAMFQRAMKIGVKVAFGTDSAVEPHGLDAREFALMVKNGMTPAQALISATASGADLLGLADKIGTLEKGKLADLVAVPGDPLQDIRQTEKVSFVMQGGKVFKNQATSEQTLTP